MKKQFLSILLLVVTIQLGCSQDFDRTKLDNFFQALEANDKFMGSVALSKNEELVYTKAIGYADIETKTKPNERTKYRIGSITKTFTAVLTLKAVEEEKIELSETIDNYFTAIPNSEIISISQLLSHRSGIHSFTANEDYLNWNTEKKSEEDLVELITNDGSDFEPGTKFEYSNSNYVLLTFILQKIYKKDYSQILEEKIIKPIDLKDTYFGKKTSLTDNECYSYKYQGDWKKESETDMSIPLGAGAIVSTPTDLTKFADALFNAELVSAKKIELMKTLKDNYGMGLFRVPFYDKFGYGHNGGIDGFTAVMYHFSDDNTSMAFTSNGSNFDNNQISIALLSAAYNKPFEIPSFTYYEVTTEDLDKYLGVYSSKDIPLKITITKTDKTLIAQATGQSSFALEAADKDKFKFDQAGIVMEFNPSDKSMVLKQGGGTFNYTKE